MRWRRLHDKIQKEHGSGVAPQGGPITAQPATPATTRGQKPTPSLKRKTKPAKEESEEESESDSKTDSEIEHKRIKTEGEDRVTEKRQTRGKIPDFKGMADSSDSGVGTHQTGPATTMYTDSSVKVEDDSMISEGSEKRKTTTQAAATPVKGTPAVEKAKVSNVNDPITPPTSAAQSFSQNPKPTPSSTTPTQRQRAVPPPMTPVSGVILRSIESDEQDEMAQLDGMSDGRFIRSKRSSQVSPSRPYPANFTRPTPKVHPHQSLLAFKPELLPSLTFWTKTTSRVLHLKTACLW